MKHKKKIKQEILKILRDSNIGNEAQNKILAKLVNYTYKLRMQTIIKGAGAEKVWSEHGAETQF